MKSNITKLIMVSRAVKNMSRMKEFCVDILGFQIVTEYRQDDDHWWTGVKLPDDGVVITLSTFTADGKLGTPGMYLFAPDIEAAHHDVTAKGASPTPITDDLYGPGSGVKWFGINDPDGNLWQIAEAESAWMKKEV